MKTAHLAASAEVGRRVKPASPARGFRSAMDGLHLWAGVIFAALLFAIFWMGTLAVFDREIDRWAQPHTRLEANPTAPGALDRAAALLRAHAPTNASLWQIVLPTERAPALRVSWRDKGGSRTVRDLHPVSGELLPEQGAPLGTLLFYPFHYSLHLKWADLGEWLVGLAALAMLVLTVSGVATHRRLFKDFFVWRPGKALQRSALDLHTVCGVLALPFHFIIALSGLIIFAAVYLQPAIAWIYGKERGAFAVEVQSRYTRAPARQEGQGMVSLDALADHARAHWAAAGEPGQVMSVLVRNPRDAHAVVELRRGYGQRVSLSTDALYFDAASGALLHAEQPGTPWRVQRFIAGLHQIQFDHWRLRWLYFVMGAAGCVMIATGSIVWVQKRAARHARLGQSGAAWVEALTVAAVPGLMTATAGAMAIGTLPSTWWTWAGDSAEPLSAAMRWFFGLWAASFAHAIALRLRGRQHWTQQCAALAALALGAAAGAGLGGSSVWAHPAALGIQLALLGTGTAAAFAAWRLHRQGATDRTPRTPAPPTPRAAGDEAAQT